MTGRKNQGEGNRKADRRYRRDAQKFVESNQNALDETVDSDADDDQAARHTRDVAKEFEPTEDSDTENAS